MSGQSKRLFKSNFLSVLSLFLFHTSNGCGKLGNPCFEVLIVSSLWWGREKWAFTHDVEKENTQGHAKTPCLIQTASMTVNRMLYVESLCTWFSFRGGIWHVTKYFKKLITHKHHGKFTVLMFYYICLL